MRYLGRNSLSRTIVITMAGLGSRFRKAGYGVPKYEIEAHGRLLFDWSLLSLKNFYIGSRVVYVCLKENNASDFLTRKSKALGLNDIRIVEIDKLTDGQATSAILSSEHWLPNSELLIYNIDTYVEPDVLTPQSIRKNSDGWVPCFRANGDHWSFLLPDQQGWAEKLVEKKRISDYATIGLYWFKSGEDYIAAYKRYFSHADNLVQGERYIAPLYNTLIENRMKVSFSDIPINKVHALGTPDELNAFLANFKPEWDPAYSSTNND